MSNEVLLGILSLILVPGGIIASLVAWRRDVKKGPIDAQQAQVADAVAVSEAATAWVKYQDDKMRAQDGKIDAQTEKYAAMLSVVERLEYALTQWNAWYMDLTLGWPGYRQKDAPPKPPAQTGKIVHDLKHSEG